MVKVLVSGRIGESSWDAFFQKLNEVQYSAHGPFDLLFITAKVFSSQEAFEAVRNQLTALSPLTIYVIQSHTDLLLESDSVENIHFLGKESVGLVNVEKNLTIAYAMDLQDSSYQLHIDSIRKTVLNMGYRGCDALITSAWPREAHQFLEGGDMEAFFQSDIGIGAGARWAAEMAILVRPRYHFVTSVGKFYQRLPYQNLSTGNGQPALFTRLISLAETSSSKDKNLKWLHALSFQPIIYMKATEIEEAPSLFSTCPYAPIGVPRGSSQAAAQQQTDLSPPFKKAKTDFHAISQENQQSGTFFFGAAAGSGGPSTILVPPNNNAKTLFIGGLGRESREQELKGILNDVLNIRRPPGKGFVFVDFASHEAAIRAVENSNRQGLQLQGRRLSVGWATTQEKKEIVSEETTLATMMNDRQLVPPTEDAKTLYIGNLPANAADVDLEKELRSIFPKATMVQMVPNKSFAFVDFENYADAMEVLSQSLAKQPYLQGRPLVVGWSKLDGTKSSLLAQPPYPSCRVLFVGNLDPSVTEEDLNQIWPSTAKVNCIRRPVGRDYAFIEFISPESAQSAMESVQQEDKVIRERKLAFGWAKGKPAAQSNESKECWFCLASPMFKAHLVVSVGQHSYLAMPRGAVKPHTALICPIDCLPSRLHLSLDAKKEMLRYMQAIESLYKTIDCALLTFERAVRTKSGRDHMQVHCVPIASHQVKDAFKVFNEQAEKSGLKFHELLGDQTVEEAVLGMEGGPYQEYFYIEVPMGNNDRRRKFVTVHDESMAPFPMQFGTEVTARILGTLDRVHWKHCLLSEAEEEELTNKLRTDYTPFDFTLS